MLNGIILQGWKGWSHDRVDGGEIGTLTRKRSLWKWSLERYGVSS
jgi:hypothetical protein